MHLKDNPTENLKKDADLEDGFTATRVEKVVQRKKYTDDYSRSSANTGYVATNTGEWSRSVERGSFYITEKEAEDSLKKTKVEVRERNDKVLFISEIIMYIAFAVCVYMMFRMGAGEKSDILFNIKGLIPVFAGLTAVLLIDAVITYIFGEKKPSLFVFALLLGVFYPIHRTRVLGARSAVGILCTVLVLFSGIMLFVNVGRAYNAYGAFLKIEDADTRHAVTELMDSKYGKVHTISTYLKKYFQTDSVDAKSADGTTVVTLNGRGHVHIVATGADTGEEVPTVLEWTRSPAGADGNAYELTGVIIEDKKLQKSDISKYWSFVTSQFKD